MGINFKESGDAIVAEKDGNGNWILWNQTDDSKTNPLLEIPEDGGTKVTIDGDIVRIYVNGTEVINIDDS